MAGSKDTRRRGGAKGAASDGDDAPVAPSAPAPAPPSPAGGEYSRLIPHLAFYWEYHANPVNQWIHIVFVPTILMTFMSMATYVALGPYIPPAAASVYGKVMGPDAGMDLGGIAALIYALFYIYLTPNWLGFTAALGVGFLYVTAWRWRDWFGANALVAAIAVNVVAWLAQFYGHGKFERRSPALLDNLVQAVLMAPLFIYIELLLKVGLLTELRDSIMPEVTRRIRVFKDKQREGKGSAAATK